MNLIESYKDRLAVSESMYRSAHNGEKMPQARKFCIAQCLNNVDRFMSESFNSGIATQRSDMGLK